MPKLSISLLVLLAFVLAACGGTSTLQAEADAVSTIVAATLMASSSQPTAAPTAALVPATTGTVGGSVCYPSSGIPPLNLYLHQVGATDPILFSNAENQTSFSVEVPAGSYVAYAWLPDFTAGGSYSNAVACGLSANCTDHSLVQFDVTAGQLTGGVAVCDWYGNPGDVPLPPGVTDPNINAGGSGQVDSGSTSSNTGSISGFLSYPSSFIPAMTVVAWDLDEQGVFYYTQTAEGSSSYTIPNLPIGLYQVAYYEDIAGGYTYAVQCGLSVNCTDHGLVYVEVFAGVDSFDVNPQDWYAPQGAFPSNPLQ
jgi:hypothetical protein